VSPASTLYTLRVIAGVLPALLVVVFAGVIALVALLMSEKRREYALAFAQHSVGLAAVLVGASAELGHGASPPLESAKDELPVTRTPPAEALTSKNSKRLS
jgi:hypothetical protein